MKLGIYTVATKNYSYALKAQARALQSACYYAQIKNPTIVLVCGNDIFFEEVRKEYECLFEESKIILIKKDDFFDCEKRKNYKNQAQLMIAKMRTLATKKLISEGCSRILSMDSDVIPKYNSIQCMLDTLNFDRGYYDVAQCPYPSQGGGSFLGGRGTPERQILEDFSENERQIPKEFLKKKKEAEKDLEAFYKKIAGEEKSEEMDKQLSEKEKKYRDLAKKIESFPPKSNVFTLNGKKWKKRGWFDYAYPAIGKGSVVPVDWVGFGCTMMSKKAALLCDWTGYIGSGTEDLYIIWQRWHPNNIKIANIAHCPSDHIIRDRKTKGKYIHVITSHVEKGEFEDHLRQQNRPWYGQDIGEEYKEENDGILGYEEVEDEKQEQ